MTEWKSRVKKTSGLTTVSRRKVLLFNDIFEEGFVIFARNEGNCCVVLENFINYRER